MRTIGISPKVTVPAALIAVAGAALLVVGLVTHDKVVTDLGIGALGAAGVHVPAGVLASPGVVVPTNGIEGGTATPDDPDTKPAAGVEAGPARSTSRRAR